MWIIITLGDLTGFRKRKKSDFELSNYSGLLVVHFCFIKEAIISKSLIMAVEIMEDLF